MRTCVVVPPAYARAEPRARVHTQQRPSRRAEAMAQARLTSSSADQPLAVAPELSGPSDYTDYGPVLVAASPFLPRLDTLPSSFSHPICIPVAVSVGHERLADHTAGDRGRAGVPGHCGRAPLGPGVGATVQVDAEGGAQSAPWAGRSGLVIRCCRARDKGTLLPRTFRKVEEAENEYEQQFLACRVKEKPVPSAAFRSSRRWGTCILF